MQNANLRAHLRRLAAKTKRVLKANRRVNQFDPSLLPVNSELEHAIAEALYYKQNASSMLTFTKAVTNATMLSLASPVGAWDPYDIKPQVFAVNTFIALPVFTSLGYLQRFCQRFQFAVRDPGGNLWSDGAEKIDVLESTAAQKRTSPKAPTSRTDIVSELSADALFDVLGDDKIQRQPSKVPKMKKKTLSKKRVHQQKQDHGTPADFWSRVESVSTFSITKATPLPLFGPPKRNYFVGYFADTETLLRNASIVPQKVDIILNPGSVLELALAREATDKVLHRDELILRAFRNLETSLRSEFHRFFLARPEVAWASSACIAKAHSSELYHNHIDYQIVIVVRSDNVKETWSALAAAKLRGKLTGHSSLEVLPEEAAAPHAVQASTVFFSRQETTRRLDSPFGCMVPVGKTHLNTIGVTTDSFFSDPTNFHTEAESVYLNTQKQSRHQGGA